MLTNDDQYKVREADFVALIKRYLSLKLESGIYSVSESIIRILARVAVALVLLILLGFILILANFAIAYYLKDWLGIDHAFFYLALFYLVILLVCYSCKNAMRRAFMNRFADKLLKEIDRLKNGKPEK